MPRQIVTLDVSTDPTSAAATFFAVLAYPVEPKRAVQFRRALCREFVFSSHWKPHKLDKSLFLRSEDSHWGIYTSGHKHLDKRFVTGFHIGLPLLYNPESVNDLPVTINSLSYNIIDDLDMSEDKRTLSTVKTRIIKPTRPVFHVATAWAFMSLPEMENNAKSSVKHTLVEFVQDAMASSELQNEKRTCDPGNMALIDLKEGTSIAGHYGWSWSYSATIWMRTARQSG